MCRYECESRISSSCNFLHALTTFSLLLGPNIFHIIRSQRRPLNQVLRNWLSRTAHACHVYVCMTSGFCRGVNGIFPLLGCYAEYRCFGTPIESNLQGP
jgi:hypothetical protein